MDSSTSLRWHIPKMSNSLEQFPKDFKKELQTQADGSLHKKALASSQKGSTLLSNTIIEASNLQESNSGRVFDGLSDSRGFLVSESASMSAQKNNFDEDTLDAWNKQRQGILEICKERRDLLADPLCVPPSETWLTTNSHAYVNLLPATVHDAEAYVLKDAQPRKLQGRKPKQTENGSLQSTCTKHTVAFRLRDAAMRDLDTLRENLLFEQQNGIFVSRNGKTDKDISRSLKSPWSSTQNVKKLETTNNAYGIFDWKHYSKADLPNVEMSEAEEQYVAKMIQPVRSVDGYNSTASDSFTNKFSELQDPIDASHRKLHCCEKIHGVPLMKRFDDPTLRPNNFQNTASTSEILPGHFTSASMRDNFALSNCL